MAMPDAPVRAFIGLGSNLEDPRGQLERAFSALAGLTGSELRKRSSYYRSAPMGPAGQPDYINAVAELDTRLAPEALLDALQVIETGQGRVRGERWGPRTLDLDLLLYGNARIDNDRLQVPHPGLPERNFVLYPLAELAPALEVPGLGSVEVLANAVDGAGIERIDG